MPNLVIFDADTQQVQVQLQGETLWLTQNQMANVFQVQKAAISKHLKNIYASGELEYAATVSKLETVQPEGQRTVTRQVEHYNLDAIISVGYRVNSTRATRFRQWATRVLREHLVQGYTPLVALALLVAESQPDHKELMVRLIEQFVLLRDTAQEDPE